MRGMERGFLEYQRRDPGYRPVAERLRDWSAVERRPTDLELHEQAARCMDCGVPFCSGFGCPVMNRIPELIDRAWHGQWREALALLLEGSCFPEFTGRVCPAPCETSCVLGIHAEPVTIRQVERMIIEKAFENGYLLPRVPPRRRPQQIAVIGSGPAGLAAAHELNTLGFHVTVFESAARAGGILRYGIPDFKLEKWVVERRLQLMRDEGVRFETGVEAGQDVSLRYLRQRFDVLLLTGGAREPRDLKVPGRELDGVHWAMDFLVQQNRRLGGEIAANSGITARDRNVVVIGGGDTGSDCVGTSWRQGARQVYQFELMPEPPPRRDASTPWPLWPLMRRESSSHQEGGLRRWSVATTSFSGDAGGRVCRLNGIELDWPAPAPGAAPRPVERPGSGFSVEADLVLLAMGFIGPGPNRLVDELGLEKDPRGFIRRIEGHRTSDPTVFVAGDMTQGASLVVRAIQDGKRAAGEIAANFDGR